MKLWHVSFTSAAASKRVGHPCPIWLADLSVLEALADLGNISNQKLKQETYGT